MSKISPEDIKSDPKGMIQMISNYDEDQLGHVRYFKNPEPVREISLVTPQNYVKKHAINMLKNEILNIVPEKFKSKKKKEVMGFSI